MPYCEIIGRTYEIIGRSNEVSRTNDITKTHVQENASYVRETMSRQNNKSYERHITPYTLILVYVFMMTYYSICTTTSLFRLIDLCFMTYYLLCTTYLVYVVITTFYLVIATYCLIRTNYYLLRVA